VRRPLILVAALLAALPGVAQAGASDPVTPVLAALAVVLTAAKVAGDLSVRAGQPAVLGELVVGVLLGNLSLVGIGWFEPVETSAAVDILARLGVIVLLFEVGLESTVADMLRVGLPSLVVALVGVVTPFALGWAVSAWLLPDRSAYVHAFIGATLTATSVGITAPVLRDLGRSQSPEARIILGAAVIDDVLGLVILAAVSGMIQAADQGRSPSAGAIAVVLLKAVAFLVGALVLGHWLSPHLFRIVNRLKGRGVFVTAALVLCFLLAWLGAIVGLAPIVGAYAAGLILDERVFRQFTERGEETLERLVHPISAFLVPVFFVLMGMHVELSAFARPEVVGLAAGLTAAAILGKQACALGAYPPGLDRRSIGIGMVPRGEVGLIFANIGLGLTLAGQSIIDRGIYGAVVMMVIVTTMVTPPALKWSLGKGAARSQR